MPKRIGILTGGGDCPGLNAVIRAVVKHAQGTYGWEVIGIEDGFKGLYEQRYMELTRDKTRGLLARGGTILGSSNRADPFHYPLKGPDGKVTPTDVSATMLEHLSYLDLAGLVAVGGDGTMRISKAFVDRGFPIVGVPKTIDNDLEATDYTFGFQTAVEVATEAIDRLHTTAESHDRIIICEVMGRYAGWIAMVAGLASGADVILIPEIPYDIRRVIKAFHSRHARGLTYSIVVVAEGARPIDGGHAVAVPSDGTRLEKLGGAGQRLANQICEHTDYEVRVTVLGHIQRGGTPTAFDRVLGTRYGVAAVDLIERGDFGKVVALKGNEIVAVDMDQAVSKQKTIDPHGELVAVARACGVELGG
ncbi:MAG: ATP-dependent 6-phosphofructokinase [Deltaproteobacteria bacterium]|nr:MAG: ATP-dependent 6-phosphofructokinase [Deltaproteobacteria bacterium]